MGIRTQALSDLYSRYRDAFSASWAARKSMEPLIRNRYEAEFLPATLALQETPVHPAPRVAMWLIIAFAFLALIWSLLGHVDVVATATGKVVPDSRSKVIQPMETASVRDIYVRDGQLVRAGDTLIELDATTAGADIERLRHEHLSTLLEILRYDALLQAEELKAEPILLSLPEGVDKPRSLAEQRWVSAQFFAYQSRIQQLEAVIARRDAEARATRALLNKLQETLPIVRQREEDYRGLLEKQFVSRHQYLELKSMLIEQENDVVAQRERLSEIEALKIEAEREKASTIAETRREWLDKLNESERRALSAAQELVKAENRGKLMSLVAPVDGVVQQLAIHTLGGVVTSAQVLMVVVPQDSPVEIEAFLPNKDVGFVRPGQQVEVKFETFSFTKYGTVNGEVISVSRDAIQDENLGLVFAIKVKLDEESIAVEGRQVALSPGMAVTVEVKTANRRLIEYFLGPLLRYSNESLRER